MDVPAYALPDALVVATRTSFKTSCCYSLRWVVLEPP